LLSTGPPARALYALSLHGALPIFRPALAAPAPSGPAVFEPLSQASAARQKALTCPVTDILAGMTLEDKVGQLFMISAYGLTVDDRDPDTVAGNRRLHGVDRWRDVLTHYPVGGVIYFTTTNNVADPEQVA